MITAKGTVLAYSMCMGCPVPADVVEFFCHRMKGEDALQWGNKCLLHEISIRKEGRLVVEVIDKEGHVIDRTIGPSLKELKEAHDKGECDMWCGWCFQEATNLINNGPRAVDNGDGTASFRGKLVGMGL